MRAHKRNTTAAIDPTMTPHVMLATRGVMAFTITARKDDVAVIHRDADEMIFLALLVGTKETALLLIILG
jgi:hypothetical protein